MDAAHGKRVIVLGATPDDAWPVVSDLRSGGHQVAFVPSLKAAREIAAAGEADFVLTAIGTVLRRAFGADDERSDVRAALGSVANDLRNLLNTLAESMDELNQLAPVTPFSRHADALTRARQRILRVQDFLLDLIVEIRNGVDQELQAADLSLEDLVEAAAITVYSEASRKDLRLVINIDEEAGRIRADPVKLKRVLANLLCNAVRRVPASGTVTVEATREWSDCVIVVSDSGEDASTDQIPAIFRPVRAVEEEAEPPPGQALSVVQLLVEQHGGRLWVESRPGGGTSVFVSLPQRERWAQSRRRKLPPPER